MQTQTKLTEKDCEFFLKGARSGFRTIALSHGLTPTQMWEKTAEGLITVGMHPDDLDDVEQMVFGWKGLTAEMLERYRWRYPDRCPLLDVLCTFSPECSELNEVQDWMLALKGAKNRRRLDLLPALPKNDAKRPSLKSTSS